VRTCIVCKEKLAKIKYCPDCAKKVIKENNRKAARVKNTGVFKAWRNKRGPLKMRKMTDVSECVGNYESAIYNC